MRPPSHTRLARLSRQLRQATPEQLAAVKRIFVGQAVPDSPPGLPPTGLSAAAHFPRSADGFKAVIEGDPSTGHFCIRFAPGDKTARGAPLAPPQFELEDRSLAAKVLELLTALDPDNRVRKAPPIKVFLLRFRQNLSLSQIARMCDCGKSLVALRLQVIRKKLPWQPQQLREMSAQVEAMQDALTDSRARSIYRKGSAYGDEDDSSESY